MLAVGFGDGVPADAVTTGLDERSLRIVFPQGSDRARLYHMFRADRPNPYHGDQRANRFLQDFAGSPVPWGDGVAAAEAAGPCSTFPILSGTADVEAPLLRALAPEVLNVLVRRGADVATAEDAVQDSILKALTA